MEIYGVYTITCFVDGKILVGEGKVHARLRKHHTLLRNNKHPNAHLQAAFNKHGEYNFAFELLHYCEPEHSKSFENYWCNLLDAHNKNHGYNKKMTNPDHIGGHSLETRKKIGTKKQKGNESNYSWRYRPVIKYDLQGNELAEYKCVRDAAKSVSTSIVEISTVCKVYAGEITTGKKLNRRTCKGFIWKYKITKTDGNK